MAQASFFYYNPESGNDSRQHDLFTPQPSSILRSSPVQPQDASLQHLYMPSMARPLAQKAAFLSQEAHILSVDTEFTPFDDLSYPRTPSLSTSSSAVSSPPQSHYLPTPTGSFFEHLTGVKEGCEHEVKSEILASSFDFSRAGSPPLTPVFVNPPNVTAASASQASELLSISSCPSLSPSPSPAPQSIASQAEHFCDPRNLLVNSRSAALVNQLDIPTLPAFIPSNDDLLLSLHGVRAKPTEVSSSVLDPIPPEVESVPFFDTLDDLDSETDFITDLSQETGFYAGAKRQRLDSIHFSEEYLSEASFEDDWTSMSPLSQADSADMNTRKSGKPAAKKQKLDDSSVDFDFGSNYAGGADAGVTTSVSGVSGQDNKEASIAPASEASTPSGQQANRRGRKQSLTDDPSKTFVCTLCSRRFRRQEHLKRHYRSLHTQDKPFECSDCGKKFSRSDNLAQHARTHGNTTTIVGINMPDIDEKTATMSAHLFETAAAVSSSSSSNGSDDEKAAKKRKRDE